MLATLKRLFSRSSREVLELLEAWAEPSAHRPTADGRRCLRCRRLRSTVHLVTDRAATDASLIERFRSGDMDAFNDLMAAHEDRVFGICLRIMRDREAALDTTQEVFITVFRKADRFTGRSAFSTLLPLYGSHQRSG